MIKVSDTCVASLHGCGVTEDEGGNIYLGSLGTCLSPEADAIVGLDKVLLKSYYEVSEYSRELVLHRLNDTMLSLCEGFLDKGGY